MKKKKKKVNVPRPTMEIGKDSRGQVYIQFTDGSIRRVRGIHG